jgi:hypothetical protein
MHRKPVLLTIMALCVAIQSCNLPSQELEDLKATLTAQATTSATVAAPTTAAPTNTLQPGEPSATSCPAIVTANINANVRKGPGTIFEPPIGNLLSGQNAPIAGKNASGTWWYINFAAGPGGFGWIAASTVTATCVPPSLAIIPDPPTPQPASGTCKDDYVWRLIRASDKVCVPQASKAQADVDNAAAASRKCTATYGPDTCKEGFVWREATPSDHVCVTGATRSQTAADNAAAASRWTPGPYGPHTCIAGYVWREAVGGQSDDVCVTPDIRAQAANDNSAAASRKCTADYGPDTCAQGYVWREAFADDHICVTGAVRTQTQNDNAAAASHTWP